MPKAQWETPDIAGMMQRRNEAGGAGATMSANTGPYVQPLGVAGQPYRPLPGYQEIPDAFRDLYGAEEYDRMRRALRGR